MTVEVYYKSGKEKHFKNVMSINTGCSYNGDKPQFEISLFVENAVKKSGAWVGLYNFDNVFCVELKSRED